MGILRLYLALCVVAEHGGGLVLPWSMLQGEQAVQIFYIISGFYMALVLSTRYSNVRDFYLSRFLRIFPTYWIVLAGTVVVSLAGGLIFNRWLLLRHYVNNPFAHNGILGLGVATLFNFTLIGQDWIMFLKQDAGQSLQVTLKFWNDPNPLYWYLLLPQAWTLAVELTFYFFAPFLNRLSSGWLTGLAIALLLGRFVSYNYLGFADVAWSYRFFPFQACFFLFGMLAYRLYTRMSLHPAFKRWQGASWQSYAAGAVALVALLYFHARASQFLRTVVSGPDAELITSSVFVLGLPVLFLAFGKNHFDRLTGEMSYPVYLLHFLVLVVIANLLGIQPGPVLARVTAVASIALAAVFYAVFISRIDIKRRQLGIKDSAIRDAKDPSGPSFEVLSQ